MNFPRTSEMDTTFLAIEDELLHRPDEARRRGGEFHQLPRVDAANIHLAVTEQRLGALGLGCRMRSKFDLGTGIGELRESRNSPRSGSSSSTVALTFLPLRLMTTEW